MTGEISLSKSITNYLINNFNISKLSGDGVKVGETNLSGVGYKTKLYRSFFKDNKVVVKAISEPLLMLSDKDLESEIKSVAMEVRDSLAYLLRTEERNKITEGSTISLKVEEFMQYKPVIDVTSDRGFALMVDKATCHVVDVQEKAWERIVGTQHVKLEAEQPAAGRFQYNPYSISSVNKDMIGSFEVSIYNKYIPPKHRFNRDTSVKLDPRYIKFLEGLFKPTCRSYAYNWLYHSTYKRMPVYLLLVGAGGIGKNLLAESLSQIHGKTNFNKAPDSCLSSKFNGHLANCTMVYYDECKFSEGHEGSTSRKNKLKEWANTYVPIEIKGVDARDEDIFCSSIVSTNNDSDVHLVRLDRKFSVMELGSARLEDSLGLEDTAFLWSYIQKPEFQHALLNYLEDITDKDFNEQVEYKGPRFDELVLSSLSGWKSEFRDIVIKGNTSLVYLSDLKETIGRIPNGAKISSFLENYLEKVIVQGEVKLINLGVLVVIEGKKVIRVNELLLNERLRRVEIDQSIEELS